MDANHDDCAESTSAGPVIDYRFANITLDLRRRVLLRDGIEVDIEPKPFALLVVLAEANGTVVSKPSLFEQLWPRQIVTDAVLNQSVLRARQALGDEAHGLIVTVHRLGYRLGVAVIGSREAPIPDVTTAATARASEPLPVASTSIFRGRAALLLTVLGMVTATLIFLRRPVVPDYAGAATLAVLPIETRDADASSQQLASSLGDALLTRLAQYPALKVPGRTSIRVAAQHRADTKRVGNDLGVAFLFDGLLTTEHDQHILSASLVRTSDGYQHWARRFEVREGGLAAAEREIATAVAQAMGIDQATIRAKAIGVGTDSSSAYEIFLHGRALMYQRSEASLRWAIRHFDQALALDPEFAEAHAGAAVSWMLLYEYSNLSLNDATHAAEPHIEAALKLAPDLADAHAARGLLRLDSTDSVGAEQALRIAVARAPQDANAVMWLGTALAYQGRVREAEPWHRRALELDPLSPIAEVYVGLDLALMQRQDAQTHFDRAIELDPLLLEAYWQIAIMKRFQQDDVAAKVWLERALKVDPSNEYTRAALAEVHLATGQTGDAEAIIGGGSDGSLAEWMRTAMIVAETAGRHDRAEALYRMALDRPDPLLDDRLLKAVALAHLDRREEALAVMENNIVVGGANDPFLRLWRADLGLSDLKLYLDLVREQRDAATADRAVQQAAQRLERIGSAGVAVNALAQARAELKARGAALSSVPTQQ